MEIYEMRFGKEVSKKQTKPPLGSQFINCSRRVQPNPAGEFLGNNIRVYFRIIPPEGGDTWDVST